jgi:hypothetical protein
MRSVADQLREEQREEIRRMTPSERLELSLRLGDEDLAVFGASRELDRDSAAALLRRARRSGRRPSGCLEESV